jgi:tubulin epsilon
MVREMVMVQVGQCGNQIGRRFWLELVQEAASQVQGGFDAAMSALFRNVDARYEPAIELDVGSLLASLRARAILVDTEGGVVSETRRHPILGDLFEETQVITDVGGAGNNWASGYASYGPKLQLRVEAALRKAVEACDSPQAFFLVYSVGGGTGSGLGSSVLELLRDMYPDLCRFNVAVYPSADYEDVITGPYNAVLATKWLTEASDCVIPLENSALLDYRARQAGLGASQLPDGIDTGFDGINDVIAQLLSHLTAGARYPGGLNMDFNEITTNLVPFQRLHYLTASFSPLLRCNRSNLNLDKREHRIFLEACATTSKLVTTYAKTSQTSSNRALACAVFARGKVASANLIHASNCLRPSLKLPQWNPDGLKMGLCRVPPLGASSAVLCLKNSPAIAQNFDTLKNRFNKLYQVKAMLHHYTQIVDSTVFEDAINDLEGVIECYKNADLNAPNFHV